MHIHPPLKTHPLSLLPEYKSDFVDYYSSTQSPLTFDQQHLNILQIE